MKKYIKKLSILIFSIAALVLCITVSHAVSQAIGLGVINASDVCMRAQAKEDSKTIIILSQHSVVNVTDIKESYYKVNYCGAYGFVPKQYCDYYAAPCEFNLSGSASEGSVNVRSSRSTDGTPLGTVSSGVTTVALEDGWFTIYYNGKAAYVRSDYFFITEYGNIQPKSSSTNISNSAIGSQTTYESTSSVNEENSENLTAFLIKSHIQLKAAAMSSSKTIKQLSRDIILTILDETDYDGWTFVIVNGITGYVPSNLLLIEKSLPTDESGEAVQETTSAKSSTSVIGVGFAQSELHVLEKNELDSSIVITVPAKATVSVLSISDGWCQIKYDGKSGYVSESDITIEEDSCDLSTYGYIKADELNVRQSANTSSKIVSTLKKGKYVDVIGFDSGWFKVSYSSNIGFVSGDYVNLTNTKVEAAPEEETTTIQETPALATIGVGTGADIAAYAQQYVGTPYVYGGSTPSGFDCSGFTMYVFSQYNIALPHGATPQLNYGTEVLKENLSAGDLVFFQDSSLSSSTASHVGIYIGNNQFVHASSSTGYSVKISSLDETYYANHYLTARRLV